MSVIMTGVALVNRKGGAWLAVACPCETIFHFSAMASQEKTAEESATSQLAAPVAARVSVNFSLFAVSHTCVSPLDTSINQWLLNRLEILYFAGEYALVLRRDITC
jgi:hypothetical protein